MTTPNSGLGARLRQQAEKKGAARKKETATLLGEQVEVRSVMVSEKHRLIDEAFVREGRKLVPILAKLVPSLLHKSLYDPASGSPAFANVGEVQAFLDSIPDGSDAAEEVQAVVDAAMKVSGFNDAATKEATKNSEKGDG